MGREFAAKQRDFENLRQAMEELTQTHMETEEALAVSNDELDSAHGMNRELQMHANALLDKVNSQEAEIRELELKNKKM